MLTVGSLFSGIGGFDLGLEKAGLKVIWQSEIEPYSCSVLKKHWPDVPNIGDITKVDWRTIERPNILCGGYPCQPFSTAGFRKGNNDPRHLWPEFRKAIRILQPDYAIMENVRGHLSLGFKEVLKDLADIGYDAEWQVIPASAVGAPHKRERLIIVAYPNSSFASNGKQCKNVPSQSASRSDDGSRSISHSRKISLGISRENTKIVADTKSEQRNGGRHLKDSRTTQKRKTVQKQTGRSSGSLADTTSSNGRNTQPQRVVASSKQTTKPREQNRSKRPKIYRWKSEPKVGRVADGVPFRVDRLKGLGNAIVPQVAQMIGERILSAHESQQKLHAL